jgi:hypothetical protein
MYADSKAIRCFQKTSRSTYLLGSIPLHKKLQAVFVTDLQALKLSRTTELTTEKQKIQL